MLQHRVRIEQRDEKWMLIVCQYCKKRFITTSKEAAVAKFRESECIKA